MFQCKDCDEEQRSDRNCGNHKKLLHEILISEEWDHVPVQYHDFEVKKIESLKFFACPLTVITGATWELVRQVNLCCNSEGQIIHLPEPELSILDQSPRFLKAVEIVRSERNSEWFFQKKQQWSKREA